MTALATFVRWKIKAPGISIDFAAGQDAQFTELRDSPDAVKFGYYCQHVFEMKNVAGAFTARERGMFGVHYINTTGGELDTTWTSADFAAVESGVQAFWSGNPTFFSTDCRLVEHRWYAFGPGVFKPNPPARVTSISPIVGSSSGAWFRQGACTVTMRTALRRHWGRIYLPLNLSAWIGTGGQISSGNVDIIAAAARTMLRSAEASQGILPCVYDRNRKQALGVISVEVDSIADVIRRRRPRDTNYRAILTS